ncbi:anti-sigma factor [Aquipluma nitroreducens]|uniref:Anti-sigma factor n=1 Tax=Aquipluma nitroreducens TaxID=2010828 RepID=A0A5K7S9F0_9BACT|nr:FecR domain-containing protein [Aquipluma nitroreducens]BBE18203.1 anti-sigma factor [Aquipluma nitroreducens]
MKTNQHIDDKNWELLAKSIYDENPEVATEDSKSVVNEIFSSGNEGEQLLKMTKQVDLYFDLKKYPVEQAWGKVESRIHNRISSGNTIIRKFISNPMYRFAAAILVAAVLLVSGYEVFYNPSATEVMLELTTANKVLNTFTLPDGTLVTLNSDTKVFYPKKFGRKTREISIEGEAFFEVKPNKNKPFIIHAGKAQIKVVGTSFSVSAYPETKLVEVIVQTGKVQVMNKMAETLQTEELILTPGDKGTLVYESKTLNKTTNQDPNFLAWKTHNLIFKATSLREVIDNLEKVYKVNISLADPKLNELLLTAQFNNYPLDFILKVIETTFKIEVQEVDGQYFLKARS